MRLTKDDRFELVRAAIKATTLESLRDYIVAVADAVDDVSHTGKTDPSCPRYVEPGGNGNGHPPENTLL